MGYIEEFDKEKVYSSINGTTQASNVLLKDKQIEEFPIKVMIY